MKNISLSLVICIFAGLIYGKGFEINVNCSQVKYDSLYLLAYNGVSKYEKIYSVKYSEKSVFKDNKSLIPGIYILAGDTTALTQIFISDSKNQNFSIALHNSKVIFENSPENIAYMDYLGQLKQYSDQFQELDNNFNAIRRQGLPQYMMQTMVDSLIKSATIIMRNKEQYQREQIVKYEGYLLTSYIRNEIEIANPPKENYSNQLQMQNYLATHYFDNFPWDDTRLINSPIPDEKFQNYALLLYQLSDYHTTDTLLLNTLNKSKKSTAYYYKFFDKLEKIIGSQTSPYWTEHLYILMLKHALNQNEIEQPRSIRYKKELSRLDKNLPGSQVPNFKILLNNGDTTDLYHIEGEYLILYFQNPECPTCIEVRDKLSRIETLNKAIINKKITFLTIYFEQNEALWRSYLSSKANPLYVHGWDYLNDIESNELYDTRVIPYMYLLDRNKKVIKKDIYWNEIEDYIKRIINN